jgi:hypothetical protein
VSFPDSPPTTKKAMKSVKRNIQFILSWLSMVDGRVPTVVSNEQEQGDKNLKSKCSRLTGEDF